MPRLISPRFVLVVLAVAAAGCPPPVSTAPQADLRFFHRIISPVPVTEESTIGAATWNAAALGALPSLPLNPNSIAGIDVDIFSTSASHAQAPGTRLVPPGIEADLFVEDLSAVNTYLRSIAPDAWTPATPVFQDATTPAQMPQSVGLPYPPNNGWFLSQRYGISPLLTSDFWNVAPPAPPPEPGEPATWNPNGIGSIKSVRLYDPGLCSTEVPFHVGDGSGLYDMFNTQIATSGYSVDYSFLTTLLDDGLNDGYGPRGGFYWYTWVADFRDVFPNTQVGTNLEYEFALDNGVLTVNAIENQDPLIEPLVAHDQIIDFLECHTNCVNGTNTVPQKFEGATLGLQMRTIAVPAPQCINGDPTIAIGLLSGIAQDGANAMQGDGATVQKTLANASNWTCNSDNSLSFVARAKRINVYGNAIELIWFDEADPTDFMYGLYALLIGAQVDGVAGVPPPSALCSRPLPSVGRNPLSIAPNPTTFVGRDITSVDYIGPTTGGDPPTNPGDPPSDPSKKNCNDHKGKCNDHGKGDCGTGDNH